MPTGSSSTSQNDCANTESELQRNYSKQSSSHVNQEARRKSDRNDEQMDFKHTYIRNRSKKRSKRNKHIIEELERCCMSKKEKIVTEEDYNQDFLKDESDFDESSMKVPVSKRIIVAANEEEEYLLKKGRTSRETILSEFKKKVVEKLAEDRAKQTIVPKIELPSLHSSCKCGHDSDSDDSSNEDEPNAADSNELTDENFPNLSEGKKNQYILQKEVGRKQNHPDAVGPDMIFNEPGQCNDGPLCRCSIAGRNVGIRHGYFAGEKKIEKCDANGRSKLYHYFLKVTPVPGGKQSFRTLIRIFSGEFQLEGFTVMLHKPLPEYFPRSPSSKWSTEYEFQLIEEPIPERCFTVDEMDTFSKVIFEEVCEMFDFNLRAKGVTDGCPLIHVMPRFTMQIGNVVRILSMKAVMGHFLWRFTNEIFTRAEKERLLMVPDEDFGKHAVRYKQQLVIRTDKKPSTFRIDEIERNTETGQLFFVHNTLKPVSYANAVHPQIGALERRLNKMKHLAMMGRRKTDEEDFREIRAKIEKLKNESKNLRTARVQVPVDGYLFIGFTPDIVAHVLMLIYASYHIRYQWSLDELEKHWQYKFKNRAVIELAMTHSSQKINFGTNPDHAKNLISLCGYRKKYTPDEKKDKKRGIHNLMAVMNNPHDVNSPHLQPVVHNERLEFLGDAVVELVVSTHLFYMLPHHNEGGLATYRSALVQNRMLAALAKTLRLDEWIQFDHGVSLCHEAEFKHALANAFEAIMAAIYLDSDLRECDRIYAKALFSEDPTMAAVWNHINEHELKREYPNGDRHLIPASEALQHLTKFEELIGIQFDHIRVLAKAMTRRNIPYNELSKGHHQRLEWLGDTVLQLVITDYLYKHFPFHHEGHLSLLRTSIVSNKTQSFICDDLSIVNYIVKSPHTYRDHDLKMKDKADLVESLIGAIYVDKGLDHCRSFVRICFLPRLMYFLEENRWNDSKSQLQQLCLTFRSHDQNTPDIPEYRTIGMEGSSNNRKYTVAVYFRKKRLASAVSNNIHAGQMLAAEKALEMKNELFEDLKIMKERKRRMMVEGMPGRGPKKPRPDAQTAATSTSSSPRTSGATPPPPPPPVSLLSLNFDHPPASLPPPVPLMATPINELHCPFPLPPKKPSLFTNGMFNPPQKGTLWRA